MRDFTSFFTPPLYLVHHTLLLVILTPGSPSPPPRLSAGSPRRDRRARQRAGVDSAHHRRGSAGAETCRRRGAGGRRQLRRRPRRRVDSIFRGFHPREDRAAHRSGAEPPTRGVEAVGQRGRPLLQGYPRGDGADDGVRAARVRLAVFGSGRSHVPRVRLFIRGGALRASHGPAGVRGRHRSVRQTRRAGSRRRHLRRPRRVRHGGVGQDGDHHERTDEVRVHKTRLWRL